MQVGLHLISVFFISLVRSAEKVVKKSQLPITQFQYIAPQLYFNADWYMLKWFIVTSKFDQSFNVHIFCVDKFLQQKMLLLSVRIGQILICSTVFILI